MHPYPRKLVHPLVGESSSLDPHRRCSSSNVSISDQENQSPTSVFSAIGSDTFCSMDSNSPNGSSSPVSSSPRDHDNPVGLKTPQHNSSREDGSTSTAAATAEVEAPTVLTNPKIFDKCDSHGSGEFLYCVFDVLLLFIVG